MSRRAVIGAGAMRSFRTADRGAILGAAGVSTLFSPPAIVSARIDAGRDLLLKDTETRRGKRQ